MMDQQITDMKRRIRIGSYVYGTQIVLFWTVFIIALGIQTAAAQTLPSHSADEDSGAASNATGVPRIVIKPEARVDGDRIFLRDIIGASAESDSAAEIGDLVIGPSPRPGKEKKLIGSWIISMLRSKKGVPEGAEIDAPKIIRVSRTCQKLSPQLLERVFLSYVASRLGNSNFKMSQFKVRGTDAFPVGRITFNILRPIPKKLYARVSLRVAVLVDGEASGRAMVSGWIDRYETVLFAERYLERDTILTADDLQMRQMHLSKAPANFVTDLQDAVGKRLKRRLKPGDTLYHNMLSVPPLIHKGDKVKLVARNGVLKIITLGIAKSSGGAGDQIRIENITSQKTVVGRVKDPSTVEVIF